MNNFLTEVYENEFIDFLNRNIDFKKYDDMIENANLLFAPSTSFKKNIESKYFRNINKMFVDKLPNDYKEIIKNDVTNVVEETYKDVLKKGDLETVMYNPPLPEHRVKNGSIVFEFLYGKNIKTLNDDEYVQNMIKQREFIDKVSELLKKEVEEKLNVSCAIFIEKRV